MIWDFYWQQSHSCCSCYHGLLPALIMKGNAKFQLEVNENKYVIFFPRSSSLTLDPRSIISALKELDI